MNKHNFMKYTVVSFQMVVPLNYSCKDAHKNQSNTA